MFDPALEEAVAHLRRGDGGAAIRLVRSHLVGLPSSGETLHLLGIASQAVGSTAAAQWFERSAATLPESPIPLAALSGVLMERGESRPAGRFLRRALALAPATGPYAVALASVLADEVNAGGTWLRHALAIDWFDAAARGNLGIWLRRRERLDEAERETRAALALLPEQSESLNNLGILFTRSGRLVSAVAWTTRAMATRPGFSEAQWNRAVAQLLAGKFDRAWPDAEARLDLPTAPRRRHARSRQWHGEDPKGRTVLLFAEQGLGDTIQFCRYAPLVARRGARTILAVPSSLVRIAKTLDGVADVVAGDGADQPHDWNCPLMSLPGLFGTTLDTIPSSFPYLAVQESIRRSWREWLGSPGVFRVGLSWQGNPAHPDDHRRSFPLAVFDRIREISGLRLVAVRNGGEPLPSDWPILDAGPRAGDIAETAGLLAELDLLITCDSVFGHLAGALSRPVWTLLAHAADWRWMLRRRDTPWYPTARLFRQPRPGDWSAVMDDVMRELAEVSHCRRHA